jgi:uncharacterized membrane-anchored protein
MNRLTTILAGLPRAVPFAAAGLIQIALIALMVADRVMILRTGVDVKLEMRAVDPRDFLRGDYVTLSYGISSVSSGDIKDAVRTGSTVFVKLAPNRDGFHEAVSVHTAPVDVAAPEVMIQGRVSGGSWCAAAPGGLCALEVHYGIEKYFVPEGEGGKIEAARNARKLAVIAAVTPAGRAAIRRLLIDGEPFYDEPWF